MDNGGRNYEYGVEHHQVHRVDAAVMRVSEGILN